jgi:hypothetical protein
MSSEVPFGEWKLIDFLAGDQLCKTTSAFEEVVGPFVKEKVRSHFPQDPLDPPDHVVAFRKRSIAKVEKQESERNDLNASIAILIKELPPRNDAKAWSKGDKKKVKNSKEMKAKNAKLVRLEKKSTKNGH